MWASSLVFINWSTLFYVCFCLKISYLIYSCFINMEPMANSTITYTWTKLIKHIFSIRHITTFLHLWIRDSAFSTTFRATVNSEITKKNAKKKMGTKYSSKGTSVYSVRIKTRSQSVTLINHSREQAHWMTQNFSPPLCRCLQWSQTSYKYWLWRQK